MSNQCVSVPASEAIPATGLRSRRPRAADCLVRINIYLQYRQSIPIERYCLPHPCDREYLTREEFRSLYSPPNASWDAVRSFASEYSLEIVDEHIYSGRLTIEGCVADCNRAFGIAIEERTDDRGTYVSYSGAIQIPAELEGVVCAITGIDNSDREVHQLANPTLTSSETGKCWFPREVAEFYNFPDNDGAGETIGILQLGGGYDPKDIETYFSMQGLATPEIEYIPEAQYIDTTDVPPEERAYAVECAADLQIAGGIAPGASYVICFSESGHDDILKGIYSLLFESKKLPTVISVSYAIAEELVQGQVINLFQRAAKTAAALGVTICVASGDGGSATRDYAKIWPPGINPHVNYPANSPYVLACGGTSLHAANGRIFAETVWNNGFQSVSATGGGVSTRTQLPIYQTWAGVPARAGNGAQTGRGIPDVAADADPLTAYKLVLGHKVVQNMGGTSCAAPLWAALIALINQRLRAKCGVIHPWLYALANTPAFRSIVLGYNGAYWAQPHWDACTGLGTPNGIELLRALAAGRHDPSECEIPHVTQISNDAAQTAKLAARAAMEISSHE